MTLLEKIETLRQDAALTMQHIDGLEKIDYTFNDVPFAEVKEILKHKGWTEHVITERLGAMKHDYESGINFIVWSVKCKVQTTTTYEALETTEQAH